MKAFLSEEELIVWGKLCKERNLNPDLAHFNTYEFIFDILVRLDAIGKRIN